MPTVAPMRPRFLTGVVQILRRRVAESEAKGESDENDIAIFVLQPDPPEDIPNSLRVPMLDNGLTVVVGRLWVTAPAAISARYVDLPQDTNDDGRFSYVTKELALGSRPTLVFDPRTKSPELRWYREGLGNPDRVEVMPLRGGVSPNDIFDAIDWIYKTSFITPAAMSPPSLLWTSASKNWPHQNAEALIQGLLTVGLATKFPYCTVRQEQPQIAGRTDLEIEEPNPLDRSIITRHAILELKVLRSFRSTGTTVTDSDVRKWIREGVEQAAAYRTDKNPRWSVLCCFDMRKEDEGDTACFTHVQECASALDIMLKRWFLYSNYPDYRKALIKSLYGQF